MSFTRVDYPCSGVARPQRVLRAAVPRGDGLLRWTTPVWEWHGPRGCCELRRPGMTRADIARNSENVCGKPRPLLHTAISTTTPKAGSKQKDQKRIKECARQRVGAPTMGCSRSTPQGVPRRPAVALRQRLVQAIPIVPTFVEFG